MTTTRRGFFATMAAGLAAFVAGRSAEAEPAREDHYEVLARGNGYVRGVSMLAGGTVRADADPGVTVIMNFNGAPFATREDVHDAITSAVARSRS